MAEDEIGVGGVSRLAPLFLDRSEYPRPEVDRPTRRAALRRRELAPDVRLTDAQESFEELDRIPAERQEFAAPGSRPEGDDDQALAHAPPDALRFVGLAFDSPNAARKRPISTSVRTFISGPSTRGRSINPTGFVRTSRQRIATLNMTLSVVSVFAIVFGEQPSAVFAPM